MIEPYSQVKVREAWAKLRPESVNMAADRLARVHPDITSKVMKNQRFRDPAGFPQPVPIGGRYHNSRLSIYSGEAFDLWAATPRHDWRDADPRKVAAIDARVASVVKTVEPTQLSHAAAVLLPDVDPDTAVRRVRGWKDNRFTNGFPEPLEVSADYVVSAMVFSLRELVAWVKWYDRWKRSAEGQAAAAENYRTRALRGAATKAAARA